MQERLHAGHVPRLAAVAVALEHRVRPVLHEVVEQVLDHRIGAAAVGAEQQRVHIAGGSAGGRRAQRLTGARPVHTLHPGYVARRRVAVHRQRDRPVGRHQLLDAGVEHGVMDDMGLAGDQHHGIAVAARPPQRARTDGVQTGLEPPLRVEGGIVGLVERAGCEPVVADAVGQGAHGEGDRAPHARRVEPVAFLLEQRGSEDAGAGALGVQGAPHHVGRALRHRTRVGLSAGVLQRQVHEDRREEHIDIRVRSSQAVQQLHRRTGAGGGAATVALRERVAARRSTPTRWPRRCSSVWKNGSMSMR